MNVAEYLIRNFGLTLKKQQLGNKIFCVTHSSRSIKKALYIYYETSNSCRQSKYRTLNSLFICAYYCRAKCLSESFDCGSTDSNCGVRVCLVMCVRRLWWWVERCWTFPAAPAATGAPPKGWAVWKEGRAAAGRPAQILQERGEHSSAQLKPTVGSFTHPPHFDIRRCATCV